MRMFCDRESDQIGRNGPISHQLLNRRLQSLRTRCLPDIVSKMTNKGPNDADLYWLSGFIDAEGSFVIAPTQNCFQCKFSISLRQDSLPTLGYIHKLTGLGTIQPYIHRKNGNPEALWLVSSQDDCWALSKLLNNYPLRAKKQRDLMIWQEALRRWPQGRPGVQRDWSYIATCRDKLMHTRLFHADLALPVSTDQGFSAWLSGFIDGEGCFAMRSRKQHRQTPKWQCYFQLGVRADEQSILHEIRDRTELGYITGVSGHDRTHPKLIWRIDNKGQILNLRNYLQHLPRITKFWEFDIWSEAIDYWQTCTSQGRRGGPIFNWQPMQRYADDLARSRQYTPAGGF